MLLLLMTELKVMDQSISGLTFSPHHRGQIETVSGQNVNRAPVLPWMKL